MMTSKRELQIVSEIIHNPDIKSGDIEKWECQEVCVNENPFSWQNNVLIEK